MSATLAQGAGKRLTAIHEALSEPEREALNEHLVGLTSAAWLARTLTTAGYPISATSIKDYRAILREAGERV